MIYITVCVLYVLMLKHYSEIGTMIAALSIQVSLVQIYVYEILHVRHKINIIIFLRKNLCSIHYFIV